MNRLPRVLLVFPGGVTLWLWTALYAGPAWWRDPESHWGPLGFLLAAILAEQSLSGRTSTRLLPPARYAFFLIPMGLVLLSEWLKPHAILHSSPALVLSALAATSMVLLEACKGDMPTRKLFGALGLAWLSLPWPAGPRVELAGWLRSGILELTGDLLLVAGIASRTTGNVLMTSATEVVVDQACSGIRSLQAVLGAAWFLGFWSLNSMFRRFILLGAGLLGVWLTNAARALGLVWTAHHEGKAVLQASHDASGFWILLVNATLLAALTRVLARGDTPGHSQAPTSTFTPPPAFAKWITPIGLCLIWVLACRESGRFAPASEGAMGGFWKPRESDGVVISRLDEEDQEVQLLLPSWAESILWTKPGDPQIRARGFHAVWLPGEVSNEFVGHHVPEVCLGNAGWEPTGEPYGVTLQWKDTPVPFQLRSFRREGFPIHVARVHLVDGIPRPQPSGNGRRDWWAGLKWDLEHRGARQQEILLLHLLDPVPEAQIAAHLEALLQEASHHTTEDIKPAPARAPHLPPRPPGV